MRIRDRETEGEGEREKDDAEDADDGNGDDDGGDARKGTPPEAETSSIPFYVKVSHFGNRRNCKSVSPSPLP